MEMPDDELAKAVQFDKLLRAAGSPPASQCRDELYLHARSKPLDQAIEEARTQAADNAVQGVFEATQPLQMTSPECGGFCGL